MSNSKSFNIANHQRFLLGRLLVDEWIKLEKIQNDHPEMSCSDSLVIISQSLHNLELSNVSVILNETAKYNKRIVAIAALKQQIGEG